jgi:hypothetical protein
LRDGNTLTYLGRQQLIGGFSDLGGLANIIVGNPPLSLWVSGAILRWRHMLRCAKFNSTDVIRLPCFRQLLDRGYVLLAWNWTIQRGLNLKGRRSALVSDDIVRGWRALRALLYCTITRSPPEKPVGQRQRHYQDCNQASHLIFVLVARYV